MMQAADMSLEPDVPSRMPTGQLVAVSVLSTAAAAILVVVLVAIAVTIWAGNALFPPAEVVSTSLSPDGSLEAVVTEYDHGGLGGEVIVSVGEAADSDTDARRIARFDWGERPQLVWADDGILTVNGVAYDVSTVLAR